MAYNLRIHEIVSESIVDGPGIRMTIFVQGCPHHCPGCHNPQTHDFQGGHMINVSSIFEQYTENPLLRGITFSGGEPFCQPQALAALAEKVKSYGGTVITYTGYIIEDLLELKEKDPSIFHLLSHTDWLIDGPYLEKYRSLELNYRGSANQRILKLHTENHSIQYEDITANLAF